MLKKTSDCILTNWRSSLQANFTFIYDEILGKLYLKNGWFWNNCCKLVADRYAARGQKTDRFADWYSFFFAS